MVGLTPLPDPPSAIPTHLLGLITTHILRSSRFSACSTSAHAALATVLERYLCVLAASCVRTAAEAGRSRPGVPDVVSVVQEMGGLGELEAWLRVNADEEGRTGRIGVTGGMEVLREHLKAGRQDPPMSVPLRYRRVRQRTSSPISRESTPDSESESETESLGAASNASRKRKRSTADSDGSLAGMGTRAEEVNLNSEDEDQRMGSPDEEKAKSDAQRPEVYLPWLPAVPSDTTAEDTVSAPPSPGTPASHVPDLPASPLRLHSPRPRDTRSVSYAPTTPGGPGSGVPSRPLRSALHAYLAPPVDWSASRLNEAAATEPELDESFRAVEARVARNTIVPDLLPSTLPYLVDAYDAIVDEQRRMTSEEAEAAKGPFDHRIAVAGILSRTSNHPLAYCGTSVPGIGGPPLPGPSSRGSHIVPAFPVLEDGTLAEDAYPIKRVAATDRPYIPRLAYEPHGHPAPLHNPTDPSSFRPLHAILSELPGRTALARSNNGQTWFEPRGKRSEWLTPDIIEHLTYITPPPPLVGKAGTAEEGKRLLYGEGVVAPGWTRDMKVWRQWRMDDDLASNVIPPDISVNGNGPTRQPMSAIMGIDPISGAQQDTNTKPPPSQPLVLLKSAWDTKDRGNWRVWIKPKSSSKSGGRGRILSKQDGQTLDVNVKGEDVEEELDDEDEETVAGTPAPQMPSADGTMQGASTPGPRIKLNTRPSLSLDTPAALATTATGPRSSFSMGPPPPPSAAQTPAGQGTPAPFKLKFKLGPALGTPGPGMMDSPSPAVRTQPATAPQPPAGTSDADVDGQPAETPSIAPDTNGTRKQSLDYFSMEAPVRGPPPAPGPNAEGGMSPMETS